MKKFVGYMNAFNVRHLLLVLILIREFFYPYPLWLCVPVIKVGVGIDIGLRKKGKRLTVSLAENISLGHVKMR